MKIKPIENRIKKLIEARSGSYQFFDSVFDRCNFHGQPSSYLAPF